MVFQVVNWVGQELQRGRYRVRSQLGAGGMGTAYLADDRHLGCGVVIKVPHPAVLQDPATARRFTQEIRSLVALVHPHVVRILDVGEHNSVPFAVLQYLAGGSLRDRLAAAITRASASPARDLSTWLPAATDALDFIHTRGYVHRDVKPDNILFDAEGHAYLGDFGIAKALAGTGAGRATVLTGTGVVLGTAAYLAPELIREEAYDGRADQYALALTVYEALGGARPFDGPLAVVFALHLTQPPPPLHKVCRRVSPALAAAVHQGLAKDPARRYPNCTAFARAVLAEASRPAPAAPAGRPTTATAALPKANRPTATSAGRPTAAPAIHGQATPVRPSVVPTRAGPPAKTSPSRGRQPATGPRRRGRRWLWLAILVSAVAAGLAGWFVVADPAGVFRPAGPGAVAEAGETPPPPKMDVSGRPGGLGPPGGGKNPDPAVGKKAGALRLAAPLPLTLRAGEQKPLRLQVTRVGCAGPVEVRAEGLPTGVKVSPLLLGAGEEAGWVYVTAGAEAEVAPRPARLVAALGALRAAQDLHLTIRPLEVAREVARLKGHTSEIRCVAFAPGGERALSAGDDGTVRLWDLRAAAPLRVLDGQEGGIYGAAFSADGKRVLAGTGSGSVRIWDAETGATLFFRQGGHKGHVSAVALSPDGRRVASAGWDKTLRVWDVKAGKEVWRQGGQRSVVWSLVFSGDGRRLLGGSGGHIEEVHGPDGKMRGFRQVGGADNLVRLWEAATGKEVARFEGHKDAVQGVAFSPDGRRILSGSGDGTLRVWDAVGGAELQCCRGHTGMVNKVAFFPDGRRALSGSSDQTVRVWDLESGKELNRFRAHRDPVFSVALSPDGARALSCSAGLWQADVYVPSQDHAVRLWELPR